MRDLYGAGATSKRSTRNFPYLLNKWPEPEIDERTFVCCSYRATPAGGAAAGPLERRTILYNFTNGTNLARRRPRERL